MGLRELLSFRLEREAESVTGVADSDVENLKCDRGRRFY